MHTSIQTFISRVTHEKGGHDEKSEGDQLRWERNRIEWIQNWSEESSPSMFRIILEPVSNCGSVINAVIVVGKVFIQQLVGDGEVFNSLQCSIGQMWDVGIRRNHFWQKKRKLKITMILNFLSLKNVNEMNSRKKIYFNLFFRTKQVLSWKQPARRRGWESCSPRFLFASGESWKRFHLDSL